MQTLYKINLKIDYVCIQLPPNFITQFKKCLFYYFWINQLSLKTYYYNEFFNSFIKS